MQSFILWFNQIWLSVLVEGRFAIINYLYCFLSEFLFWFRVESLGFGCKILLVFWSLTCHLWVVFTHWPAENLFRAIRRCLRNFRGHQGWVYLQNPPKKCRSLLLSWVVKWKLISWSTSWVETVKEIVWSAVKNKLHQDVILDSWYIFT